MKVVAHFDGACSMKRGIAAGAGVVYAEDGEELGYQAKFLTSVTTPVAEYTGLLCALQLSLKLGVIDVVVWGDSELVIRQVTGTYRCLSPPLIFLRDSVWSYQAIFKTIGGSAVVNEFPKAGPRRKRRWSNDRADEIARECLESDRDLYSERR